MSAGRNSTFTLSIMMCACAILGAAPGRAQEEEGVAADNGEVKGEATVVRVGAGPGAIAEDPGIGQLYIANRDEGTVSILNARRLLVMKTLRVGSSPAAIAVNAYTNRVYVANFRDSTVSVINGVTQEVMKTIPVGLNPAGIAVDPERNRIYVANNGSNTLSIIDGVRNRVTAEIEVGKKPWSVVFSAGRNQVLVANRGSNTLTVLDSISGTVRRELPVRAGPAAIVVTSDGKTIYVASAGTNTLTIIDPEKVTTLPVGQTPTTLALDEGAGVLYVGSFDDRTISVVDTAIRKIVRSVDLGDIPGALMVPAAGGSLCATARTRGELVKLELDKPKRLTAGAEEREAALAASGLTYLGAPLYVVIRQMREASGHFWASQRSEDVDEISSVVRELGVSAATGGSIYDEDLFSYALGLEYLDTEEHSEDYSADNDYLLYSANLGLISGSDYPVSLNSARSISDYIEGNRFSYRILTESDAARVRLGHRRLPVTHLSYERTHNENTGELLVEDETETVMRVSMAKSFARDSQFTLSYERNEFKDDLVGADRVSDDFVLSGTGAVRESLLASGDVEYYTDEGADTVQSTAKLLYFPAGTLSGELGLDYNDTTELIRNTERERVWVKVFKEAGEHLDFSGDVTYYTSTDDFGAEAFTTETETAGLNARYSREFEKDSVQASAGVGVNRYESTERQDTVSGSLYLAGRTRRLKYGSIDGFYSFYGDEVSPGEDWREHIFGVGFESGYVKRFNLGVHARRMLTEFGEGKGTQDFVSGDLLWDALSYQWLWGTSRLNFGYLYEWASGEQTVRRGTGTTVRLQRSSTNYAYGDFRIGARPTRRSRVGIGVRREESFDEETIRPSSVKVEARVGYDLNALDLYFVFLIEEYDAGIEPDRQVIYFEGRRSF